MNLTSRRNPLSGLSFSLFFFLRERKRGLRRRRSHKISVSEAKCNICRHKRAGALHLISHFVTASPQGEAKVGIMLRGLPDKHVLPRIQKLFPLCTISLLATSPNLPVPRGVSGGAAALSSLCRRPFLRRYNESHFAAEPPERSFFFPLFLSPRKKKRFEATTQSQNLCCENEIRQTGDS